MRNVHPTESVWSFEAIYTKYYDALFRYLYRLVGNREQALDLLQDTFVKVLRALPNMDAQLNVSAWLYRIARNTANDAFRQRLLIKWIPWQDLDHEPINGESPDPQEYYGRVEFVRAALQQMPYNYRSALLLYLQEGCTYQEIALRLNLAESGVRMYLSRARRSFRELYLALVDQEHMSLHQDSQDNFQ